MTSAAADRLADEVAEAHGAALLATAAELIVSFSSGGLAFTTKRQPTALTNVTARLTPLEQHVTLVGEHPRPWSINVANSDDLRRRLNELRSGVRRVRWTPEDLGFFAAAALSTYLTMPLLVGRAHELVRLRDTGELRRLRVRLPPSIAGHGSTQVLHIDPAGLVRRHDYTARAFGSWARAAQAIDSYEVFDGVPIGTVRRVSPRVGRPLPAPTLVWIRIHSVRLQAGVSSEVANATSNATPGN